MRYVAVLVLAVAVLTAVEWSTDEDMVTMLVILVIGALLGWLFPRLSLSSGLVVGLVVPVTVAFSKVTGWLP